MTENWNHFVFYSRLYYFEELPSTLRIVTVVYIS